MVHGCIYPLSFVPLTILTIVDFTKVNWDYAEFVSLQVNIQQPDLRKQNVPCSLPYGHAVLNDSNNIEWHALLGPDTELELKLIYSVESPLQDGVEGLPKS